MSAPDVYVKYGEEILGPWGDLEPPVREAWLELADRVDRLRHDDTARERQRPLVTVAVRTRHPEDYELVNHADGSRWEIRDGTWKRSTRG